MHDKISKVWVSLPQMLMTLNNVEVNIFRKKKKQILIEIISRLQTRLSLLALRVTLKTNMKCFGHPSVNLAVYNTGQQKNFNTLSNR